MVIHARQINQHMQKHNIMHERVLLEENANLADLKSATIVGARSKQGQNQKNYENHAETTDFIKNSLTQIHSGVGRKGVVQSVKQ